MTAAGRTDGRHVGDSLPFWQNACAEGRRDACARLIQIEQTYCGDNSGWACHALGEQYLEGKIVPADQARALDHFTRACELRFQPGCLNLIEPGSISHPNPRPFDLRLLLREGGLNLLDAPEADLYSRACDHGWAFACGRVARAQ
jgi:TPR repeat protein